MQKIILASALLGVGYIVSSAVSCGGSVGSVPEAGAESSGGSAGSGGSTGSGGSYGVGGSGGVAGSGGASGTGGASGSGGTSGTGFEAGFFEGGFFEGGGFEGGFFDGGGFEVGFFEAGSTDGGGVEASTIEAGPLVACHRTSGTSTSKTCAYIAEDTPGFTCPTTYKAGSCPSPVVGCCVDTIFSGAYETISAVCYYNATTAAAAEAACTGTGEAWTTTSP